MMLFNDQLLFPDAFPWRFADIVASDAAVISVLFTDEKSNTKPNDLTHECKLQLSRYFNKELRRFNLPLFEHEKDF